MKKRILSIALAMCMSFSCVPQVAFANSNEDSLIEGDLSWENDVWIGGTPVTRAQLAGVGWMFDPDTYTLTLRDGFTSSNTTNLQDSKDNAAVIYVKSNHDLTIEIEGDVTFGAKGWENALTSDNKRLYGIYALSSHVTITGSHSLDVYGSETALWCKSLTVDGTNLNCRSYYTALKVCSNAGSFLEDDKADMVVKNGAKVFARTTHGLGIRPNYCMGNYWFSFNDYGGGAGIFVNGSLRVENSTVDSENTCYELPPAWDAGSTIECQKRIFCTSIYLEDDLVVSGNDARVTGKLENQASNFGDGGNLYSKLGAVIAKNFHVRNGATIEGFITNGYLSQVAQGLRRFDAILENGINNYSIRPARICLDGEGTVRNGIKRNESEVNLGTEEFQYTEGNCNFTENTKATSEYTCYREVKITGSSAFYFRTNDEGGLEYSCYEDFSQPYSIDNNTIDLRDLSDSVFVNNGWQIDWGITEIHIKSGDWTIIPPCETEVEYFVEGGNLTIQPQDGMEYAGGKAHIAEGAVMSVDGNGIAKNWDAYVYNSEDEPGGTLRFVSGTVENASADNGVSVTILGGNINFNPESIMQVVRNGKGLQIYKDVYLMQSCNDELIEINTGEELITPEGSYYYPIGENRALVVWTVNDLPINYVTVASEGGKSYNLISGGSVEGLGSEYHKLVTAERYREFVPNPNHKFFRNPDESVTMNAAGSIDTYENRLDSAFFGPYLIDSKSDLDSSLRAEWSYQNDSGEKVFVGGNSLTCTIDDLSDIVNFRTYTCTVYEITGNGTEKAIGSYNAKVYVMRWEQTDVIRTSIGKEVTFTVNPSQETEWVSGFLKTLKWQVNKGTEWEDIPDSDEDSYTVKITEENVGYKYRRVIYGSTIGNFDKHENGIYVEFNSPELSFIPVPDITSQPQNLTIHEKDTAKHVLSVTAENAGKYQWQKKIDNVFTDIEGQNSSTLDVGFQDEGTYRCVVSNAYGETFSEEVTVKIKLAPVCGNITGGNAKFGEKAQSYASFSNVSGDGSVNIKWQYSTDDGNNWVDVVSQDTSENINMSYIVIQFGIKPIDPPGATTIVDSRIDGSTMTINKTTADMDGWKVRCVLSDAFGVYYSNIGEISIDMSEYNSNYEPAEIIDDETSEYNGYYAIENAKQLYWFADKVNNDNANYGSANAVLTADITVNQNVLNENGELNSGDFRSWTPIGNDSSQYRGTFDGNNHTISGLYLNDEITDYAGLTGYVSKGNVSNISIEDSYFKGKEYVGSLCGMNENGTITNCCNTGTVIGTDFVGGLCGNNSGTIKNCYNTDEVIGSGNNVGGVCGNNSGTITNCYYLAEIPDENGGKNTAQFESGEVAYLLSKGENGEIWGQEIGKDNTPVLNGKKVLANIDESQFANDIIVYGQSASLDGTIGFNIYISANDSYNWEKEIGGVTGVQNSDGLYVFTYNVAPKDMDKNINFTVNDKIDVNVSVSEYLNELSQTDNESLENLAKSMNDYGDATKSFFSGETVAEQIVIDDLSSYNFTTGTIPEGISYYGSSLILESETTIRHYFTVAEGYNISDFTFTVDGAEVMIKENEKNPGYYYIEIQNISAEKLGISFIVSVNGEEVITNYSALSYVNKVLESDTADDNLKNLVKALYIYNRNALEYINKA